MDLLSKLTRWIFHLICEDPNRCSFSLDIIFFIYLYQRWIYRIDPTRVNEFGVSKEMLEKREEEGSKKPTVEAIEDKTGSDVECADEKPAENGESTPDEEPESELANGVVRKRGTSP